MVQIVTSSTYDEVPYEGGIVPGAHPDRLSAIARIFGVPAAHPASCSVLEIGCAAATNLLPMAYGLPNSTFVGIDPSERQIEMGRQFVEDYGARNVELHALDVRDTLTWDRKFDFIICHGVFSWVEDEVQDAILEASRRLLNPNGVAYISYNTLPGFHSRSAIREMLRFHASHFDTPAERAQQSRSLLAFLAESTEQLSDTEYGAHHGFLQNERELLEGMSDSYLIHEHLTEHNEAFYFHEFVDLAAEHELQYLGDAAFQTMMVSDLPGDIGPRISAISSSQLTLEQYRDFVTNRMFRKTLLCHNDVNVDREISTEDLAGLEYRKRIAIDNDGNWLIKKVGSSVVQVTDSSVASVLRAVSDACPRALPFEDLRRDASALLGEEIPVEKLAGILLSLLGLDAIEPRTWTPTVALEVGEYPEVFLPARRQPADRREMLPLPQHGFARPSPFIAAMLDLVDGTRTTTQIVDAVEDAVRRGVFYVDGAPPEGEPSREELEALVVSGLEELRGIGLLVAK